MDSCIICGGTEAGGLLKLREKGSRGINIASKKRRDTLNAIPGQSVHLDCRKNYTNPILINKYLKDSLNNGQPDDTSVKLLRSKDVFSFPDHCLFCGCQAKNNNLKRGNDVFPVRTHDFQASIIDICLERQDEWSDTVYGRIQSVNGNCGVSELPGHPVKYILDGGSLIQKIQWTKGTTFGQICDQYVNYLQKKYPDCLIVFDGYTTGASIKDCTHFRRSKGIISPDVTFTSDMQFKSRKDILLANKNNKQNFINLLGQRLVENGYQILNAAGDADTLIVSTALESSLENDVVIVGEDTDLLVLILVRLRLYTNKSITGNKMVQVKSLPPTSDAASFHVMRTYYQCQEWINLNTNSMDPLCWGWTLRDNKLMPITSSLPPAPENLLKIIHCNCKSNCDSRRCTCRKHGLSCSVGCGQCRGTTCTNSSVEESESSGSDDTVLQ